MPLCVFGRPFVKWFAPVRCLSVCLPVTLVYCGQMVGWIKMKLGVEVRLGPGHVVLYEDPAPRPQMGTAPNFQPMFVLAKWLVGSRCHLVQRYALAQATLC